MSDIFDRLAGEVTPKKIPPSLKKEGDIFDRIALPEERPISTTYTQPSRAEGVKKAIGKAGQFGKEYYEFLHTPTERPTGVMDFLTRVVPEDISKTTVGFAEFPYQAIKSVTDPLIAKGIYEGDIVGAAKGVGKGIMEQVEGFARFTGEPIGLYGWDALKERWLTSPVSATLGIAPLVKGVHGYAKARGIKPEEAPKRLLEEADKTGKSVNEILNEPVIEKEARKYKAPENVPIYEEPKAKYDLRKLIEEPVEKRKIGNKKLREQISSMEEVTKKKFRDMTVAERENAVFRHKVTGAWNDFAYEQALSDPAMKKPVQVSIDVNGLKWVNDNYGHQAGNELLKKTNETFSELGVDLYHIGGDEFAIQANSLAEADAIMQRAKIMLAEMPFIATGQKGETKTFKGMSFGYGKGSTVKEAEFDLIRDKEQAITRGERAKERGGKPPSLVEVIEKPTDIFDKVSSFTLTAPEAPKVKAPVPKQGTLIDVQPKFPEGKIPTKEAGFTMLEEIRAREAEARQTIIEEPKGKTVRVPKPQKINPEMDTLTDFVRKSGGLSIQKETGMKGEIRDRFSIKGGYNLVDNKTGRSLDDMAEIAWEAGYFRERPTVAELIDALDEDIRSKQAGNKGVHWSNQKQNWDDVFAEMEEEFYRDRGIVTDDLAKSEKEGGFIRLPQFPKLGEKGKSFREFWSPLSTLPEGELYKRYRYKSFGDIDRSERFAMKIWGRTKNLKPELKHDLFRFLDGDITIDTLPESIRPLAQTLQTTNNLIGKMLVKRGLLDEETFAAHRNKYVRYLYLKHILGNKGIPIGLTGKLDLTELKKRKDLTKQEKRAIGLIEDVSVAEPVTVLTPLTDIAKFDFYSKIAENPNWTWQSSMVEVPDVISGKLFTKMGIGRLVEEVDITRTMHRQAPKSLEIKERLDRLESALDRAMRQTKNVPEDFIQLSGKGYGPLDGAFIRKEIARDIQPVFSGFSNAGSLSRTVNHLIKLEEQGMAAFKIGKTALNWPTWTRNIVSNVIQLNMSGIPLYRMPRLMEKAGTAMLEGNRYHKLALRNGLFKTNWSAAEIGEVLDTVRTLQKGSFMDIPAKLSKLAKYYGKIDDFFKLTKFIEQMENGVDVSKAIIEAQKWGMDYSLAHPSIKLARRHAIPFASYSYKIAPLVAESLAKRPWVIGKYLLVPYLMYEFAKQNLDLTEEEWKKLEKDLPMYIQKENSYTVLPWKSPEGNVQWINLEYFLPYGNMLALAGSLARGDIKDITQDIGLSNPFIDILYTMPKSAVGGAPPKDPFTGRDIYNRLDTPTEKAIAMAEWFYNKWAPSMLTRGGAAGYTERIGKPDRYGRVVTPGQAAGRWFGVNIVAPSRKQSIVEKRSIIKDLQSSLMRVLKDPTISSERKRQYLLEYQRQKKELLGKENGEGEVE